jgi:hypothetical protein
MMNKTIKELFEKAGGTVEVCDVTQDEVLTYSENCDPEEFAQLIVRKCVFELIHETANGDYNPDVHNLTANATTRIFQKFGLK